MQNHYDYNSGKGFQSGHSHGYSAGAPWTRPNSDDEKRMNLLASIPAVSRLLQRVQNPPGGRYQNN